MSAKINIYKDKKELAKVFSKRLKQILDKKLKKGREVNLLLPGGFTPNLVYEYISANIAHKIDWGKLHLFWGDERCVPSDHPESNFGMANKYLISSLDIPLHNIHPIVGESHPFLEADRYTSVVNKHFNIVNEIPRFDIIILGMGDDGHTASMFPGQLELFHSNRLFEVCVHPETNQTRISATGKVLNHGEHVFFLVTGDKKAEMARTVLRGIEGSENLPAYLVKPESGNLEWYLDKAAARYI